LTDIGTTQPLPGLLRWIQHGSRDRVALGVCAVVLIIAAAVGALPGQTDGMERTAIQVKTKPKLEPPYDEASSQYRNPISRYGPNVFEHRVGLLNARGAAHYSQPASRGDRHERPRRGGYALWRSGRWSSTCEFQQVGKCEFGGPELAR
jgi:hypothetical protein